MATFSSLPAELVLHIASYLPSEKRLHHDIFSLSRTCYRYFELLQAMRLRVAATNDDGYPLAWAIQNGRIPDVLKFLTEGRACVNSKVAGHMEAGQQEEEEAALHSLCRWAGETMSIHSAVVPMLDHARRNIVLVRRSEPYLKRDRYIFEEDGSPKRKFADGDLSLLEQMDDFRILDRGEAGSLESLRHRASLDTNLRENHPIPFFCRPIHLAAATGQEEIVRILLNESANLELLAQGLCFCQPMLQRFSRNAIYGPWWREILVEHAPRWTALHLAICHGRTEVAKLLLIHGASMRLDGVAGGDDPSYEDKPAESGVTALHQAAGCGNTELVTFILDGRYETDVDVEDGHGLTPLYWACRSRNWSAAALLLQHGADLNRQFGGQTMLLEACQWGYFPTAAKLIDLGADVTGLANTMTVHHSALQLCFDVDKLAFGPRLPDAAEHTLRSQRCWLIKKLLAKGVPLNPAQGTWSALELAIYHFDAAAVRILLAPAAHGYSAEVDPPDIEKLMEVIMTKFASYWKLPGVSVGVYEMLKLVLDHADTAMHGHTFDATVLELLVKSKIDFEAKRDVILMLRRRGAKCLGSFEQVKSLLCDSRARSSMHTAKMLWGPPDPLPAHRLQRMFDRAVKNEEFGEISHAVDLDSEGVLLAAPTFLADIISLGGRVGSKVVVDMLRIGYLQEMAYVPKARVLEQCLRTACEWNSPEFAQWALEKGGLRQVQVDWRLFEKHFAHRGSSLIPLTELLLAFDVEVRIQVNYLPQEEACNVNLVEFTILGGFSQALSYILDKRPKEFTQAELDGYLRLAVDGFDRYLCPKSYMPRDYIILLLLQHGADPKAAGANGTTPLAAFLHWVAHGSCEGALAREPPELYFPGSSDSCGTKTWTSIRKMPLEDRLCRALGKFKLDDEGAT